MKKRNSVLKRNKDYPDSKIKLETTVTILKFYLDKFNSSLQNMT